MSIKSSLEPTARWLSMLWTTLVLLGWSAVNARGFQAPSVPPAPVGGQSESAEGLDAIHASAKPALIKCWVQIAAWCNDNELYQERDNLYKQVLDLDTDNADARKGLRYARNVDGTWKEPAPRAAKNRNDKALAQLPAKRSELLNPYCDSLLECMERAQADEALRNLVIAEVQALNPDNARLHLLFNEVKLEGKWTVPETLAGKTQREVLKALIKAKQDVPPATALDPGKEGVRTLGKSWKCALQTPHVRIVGDVPESECRQIARQCEIANSVLHECLGCPLEGSEKYTVYVFASDKEKYLVVEKLPDQGIEGRAFLVSRPNVTLGGASCLFLSDADPAKRLDCAVRCFTEQRLSKTFGSSDKPGWAADGVSWYLTLQMCGTHLSWTTPLGVSSDPSSLNARLSAPASSWMAEAAKLFDCEKAPRLDAVVLLDLAAMHDEDVLASCALATFLIEGHPKELPEILNRVGKKEPTAEVIHSALGMTMDELQKRVARWLKERQ